MRSGHVDDDASSSAGLSKAAKRAARKDEQAQGDLQCQASINRKELEERSDHHAKVDQRLEHLEKVFADSADKYTLDGYEDPNDF